MPEVHDILTFPSGIKSAQRTELGAATAVPEGRAKVGGTTYLWLPGFSLASVGTLTLTANRLYYLPVVLSTPVTLDMLTIEITTGVASTNIRLGIYNADTDWQPTSLVVDAGAVSSAAAGAVSASISVTLPPGRYLNVHVSDGAPTVRLLRGGITPIDPAMGATPSKKMFYVGSTYGALPSTGTAWTTLVAGSAPAEHQVFWRVSAFL